MGLLGKEVGIVGFDDDVGVDMYMFFLIFLKGWGFCWLIF